MTPPAHDILRNALRLFFGNLGLAESLVTVGLLAGLYTLSVALRRMRRRVQPI